MIVPFTTAVVLHRRTLAGKDAFGDPTYTDVPTTVYGAFYAGQSSGDNTGVDEQPVIYLQPGTDVTFLDSVTVNGQLYEVDGNPVDWAHPFTGWRAGVEVHLRAIERPT